MRVEVVELIRKDVSVGNEVELLPSEPFLHFHKVVAKTVLASNLVALREVVDLLKLVEPFVDVALAGAG